MTYDDDLIIRVSSLLGDEDNEYFIEEEIIGVLLYAENINHALYILYTQKAGKVVNSATVIKSIKAGNESVEKLNALELQKAALIMAEHYRKLWQEEKEEKEINTTFLY